MSGLKTTPNIGTYFPMKVPVKDDEMHYLVPVMKWHNTEHDAQLAHQFLAALARKDAALRMAVEALERIESVCNDCFRVGAMIHPNELLELLEEVEPVLADCRAELEGK